MTERALDINSSIPLINSLNYLTYLTSNSSKVRETVANDGALERLVSILRSCHLSLFELLDLDLENFNEHENIKDLWKEKKTSTMRLEMDFNISVLSIDRY
ncbi:CGH_1_HP_G0101260.mRNA.1.CDS.1 [Saccharomyces cerevisiae]|nr:CGH_1_HP_G0101260.mRNA.1.CDS.1 [Saccharomyces cerevisiae]CAI6948214.1 CGH_1_HP_G0101260.mRNA.1.CDS.1 [Saccharomyces cerevisiae]